MGGFFEGGEVEDGFVVYYRTNYFFQVTYADLSLIDNGYNMLDVYPAAFDKTPLLKGLYERVMSLPNVKKHCDARPVTPM